MTQNEESVLRELLRHEFIYVFKLNAITGIDVSSMISLLKTQKFITTGTLSGGQTIQITQAGKDAIAAIDASRAATQAANRAAKISQAKTDLGLDDAQWDNLVEAINN